MINAKIMIKSGTTEELDNLDYLPLKGEVVIYDDRSIADSPKPNVKFKIGNGETKLNALEFIQQEQIYFDDGILKANNQEISIKHNQIILPNNKNWDGQLSIIEDKIYILKKNNWVEDKNREIWTYTYDDNNIEEEDYPIIDIVLNTFDKKEVSEILENYNLITRVDTGDKKLIFYCYEEKPEIDLAIRIKINHQYT